MALKLKMNGRDKESVLKVAHTITMLKTQNTLTKNVCNSIS